MADRRAQIEARLAEATPGPWEVRHDDLTDEVDVWANGDERDAHVAFVGMPEEPRVHADAFLLSYAALLRETGWRVRAGGGSGIDHRTRVRLAASAAYLPLVRGNSPGNRLLPLIDAAQRQVPERRAPRYPLHALRRYALPE